VPQETFLGSTHSTPPATSWHSGILAQLASSLGQQIWEGRPGGGRGEGANARHWSDGQLKTQGGTALNRGQWELGRLRQPHTHRRPAPHPHVRRRKSSSSTRVRARARVRVSGTRDKPSQGHNSPGWMKILPSPISPHAVAAAMMRTIAFTCECECVCVFVCVWYRHPLLASGHNAAPAGEGPATCLPRARLTVLLQCKSRFITWFLVATILTCGGMV